MSVAELVEEIGKEQEAEQESNILQAKVSIKGTRPALWHHFGLDAIPTERKQRTGVAGNDPQEWRKTYLATPEGQLYVEPSYIFGCLRSGAYYTKRGKGSIMKLVAATLVVDDEMILFDRFLPLSAMHGGELTKDTKQPVYLDVRPVINPGTKGRNIRYRVAAATGWTATFTIVWDGTIVSRGEMEAVVNDAGRFVGLCSGRAIGFGRFTLDSFVVTEM